jgi:hypothetical protein
MFEEVTMEFETENANSIKIANDIEGYLPGMGLIGLIVATNSISICVELPKQYKQRNSIILILGRGSAKSTLLIDILAKSNKKMFVKLDKKLFESELVQKPKEYFHNKVLIHDDLIIAFTGMSTKQRQQLVNFFTSILSDKEYSRERNNQLKDVDCLCIFGLAKENYAKYMKELMSATFFDRFSRVTRNIDREDKVKILEHRDITKENNIDFPKIKLPYKKKKTKIELILTKEMKVKRNKLAMELDDYNILSFARAQNFIDVFLMSNALLNGRKRVKNSDLEMYLLLHKYHVQSSGELDKEEKIAVMKKQGVPNKEIMKKLKIPTSTFYDILKRLSEKDSEILSKV